MNVLSASVAVLCCSLFTASLLKLLAPSGKTEKILKLIISLFILICLTNCIKTIIEEVKNFSKKSYVNQKNAETFSSAIDKSVLKVTGDYMVSYIENLLLAENVKYNKLTVTVDTDKQGGINITDICIYMDETNADSEKASEIIKEVLGITPRLVLGE